MSLFSDPVATAAAAHILPGEVVADFGAGDGRLALEIGKALITAGRVYAIDVRKDLLERVGAEAARSGVPVQVLAGNVEKPAGSLLADGCVDLVIMSNVLFELHDRTKALTEAKRILKPGHRLMLVDWADSFGGIGPARDRVVSKEAAVNLFEKNGFSKNREFNAGSHHYGYIFTKL